MDKLYAHAWQGTVEVHQHVGQNVLWVLSALRIKHVSIRSVQIHVLVHVDFKHVVK